MEKFFKSLVFLAFIFATFGTTRVSAQEVVAPEGYIYVDSIIFKPAATVDTSLVGKNIFYVMPSGKNEKDAVVEIYQTSDISEAMRLHVLSNKSRNFSGYRVRIFFDNKQNARTESESTLKRFESLYHDVPAYRTYVNPYFKVTVGDFRTKSEAMALLSRIRHEFPSAFVVKENIGYPVLDKENAYIVDTIKVLRPIVAM